MEFKGTKYKISVEVHPRDKQMFIVDAKGFHYNPTKKEAEANARLFECAPELLEMVIMVYKNIPLDKLSSSKLEQLIKRATE